MRRHAVKEKRMHRAPFEQLEHDERSVEETAGWRRTLVDSNPTFQIGCWTKTLSAKQVTPNAIEVQEFFSTDEKEVCKSGSRAEGK